MEHWRSSDRYDLDTQLAELEGFLNALQITRAVVVGFSASGGKAIRCARLYPSRVAKFVVFDPLYSYVAPGLEERVGAAIARSLGGDPDDSADLPRHCAEMCVTPMFRI